MKPGTTANQFIKWSIPRGGSYIISLLIYNNRLYNFNWNGAVECYDPDTGNKIFIGKVGRSKSFIASPVASDGKIYFVSEDGIVYIIQDGNSFKLLQEIPLNDICLTAPAITDGIIFFRTQNSLIAVSNKKLK